MIEAPQIDVSVLSDRWATLDFDAQEKAQAVLTQAWPKIPLPKSLKKYEGFEVSVALSDDEQVQTLNRDFRDMDKPTNVLSFASMDMEDNSPEFAEKIFPLGDIVIAFETTEREAAQMDVPFETHYTHLLIHGFLHLLGFDHIDEKDAESMESLEIQILGSMGIENPYARSRFVA